MLSLLNSIMGNTESELKRESIKIILNLLDENMTNKEILDTVEDIVNHGWKSGIVPALIYYNDTELFFDRHADEIFNLYNESVKEFGQFDIELSKNNLTWFAFEKIIYSIFNELEDAYSFMIDSDGNEY